ncbi:hypothetical protein C8R45DRAFT_1052977 [Mycena sanguinolenta]|nr:hypothetical protein C8R45DRAFT_1052977 [Mycena sanguinolenta]
MTGIIDERIQMPHTHQFHADSLTRPGELRNHPDNVAITDEMLEHVYFRHIVSFTNCLFCVFAPLLFLFYKTQMALLAAWDSRLRWPFEGSCAITSLGSFDADCGGPLILWDLKLIIRFPAGAIILIPSAILHHSNVPIQPHETRYSFVQYTAGGLFRWISNGYMTDESFEQSATQSEKEARAAAAESRWEEGMKMFSVLDEL